MEHDRLDVRALGPDLHTAIVGVEKYVRRHVDPSLLHLVKLRASMVNGCAFCVDMHEGEATAGGETTSRIVGLTAWRDSPFYSETERAALALTDAITVLGDDGVPDDVWVEAAAHFDDKALLDLVGAIALINLWNRLAIALRSTPLSARAT